MDQVSYDEAKNSIMIKKEGQYIKTLKLKAITSGLASNSIPMDIEIIDCAQ